MNNKERLKIMINAFEKSGIGYGDHINHSDLDQWADIETPDVSKLSPGEQKAAFSTFNLNRLTLVDGFRDYLLIERQMYIKSVPGSGYVIIQPEDQTNAAVERGIKQIQKGLKHATQGVEHVNKAMLTSSQREYNASVSARMKGLGVLLGKKRDYITIE